MSTIPVVLPDRVFTFRYRGAAVHGLFGRIEAPDIIDAGWEPWLRAEDVLDSVLLPLGDVGPMQISPGLVVDYRLLSCKVTELQQKLDNYNIMSVIGKLAWKTINKASL